MSDRTEQARAEAERQWPELFHLTQAERAAWKAGGRWADADPLTLDALREAWENAEVPTRGNPIREGDELIVRHWEEGWEWVAICPGSDSENWISDARVLHRAPQPEPWQALADVLRAWDATPETGHTTDSMARWFYERGVRVVGGDES